MSDAVDGSAESMAGRAGVPRVHIDTTLQLEQFKIKRRRELVRRALQPYRFRSTSTYARHELNRTLLRDLVYLFHKAQQVQNVGELLDAINGGFSAAAASRNRLRRMIEAIGVFLERRGALTPSQELVRFREHIAVMLLHAHTAWRRSVTHEYNGTACVRADEQPQRSSSGRIKFALPDCRRNKVRCQVHTFFLSRLGRFQQIADTAERLGDDASPQMRSIAHGIRAAAHDATKLCDDRECQALGDALIAIDGDDQPVYAANNDAEWRPISEALGKELLNPLRGFDISRAAPADDTTPEPE